MENRFLDWLKESKKVYYIYMRGSRIYGLETKDSDIDFLVICDKYIRFPKEFYEMKEVVPYNRHFNFHIKVDNYDFIFKTTEEWFNDVLKGSIEAWECACLNKKFVIKEYVKLLMKTDPLKLRKQIDKMINSITLENFDLKEARKVIRYCVFANQIIENHKIVNFKEANSLVRLIQNSDYDAYINCLQEPLKILRKSTDGMLKRELQKKIVQK